MKRFLILVVLLILAGLIFVYSGVYNVAATVPHTTVVEWVLNTTMKRSVSQHASAIVPPDGWDSPDQIALGAAEYDEMCVLCHGAPGVKDSGLAKGLYPPPHDMDDAVEDWGPAEFFWITKHGIKDTGMPAWGESHDDKELWALAAFSQKMVDMSPQEYKRWVAKGAAMEHKHGNHAHGDEASEAPTNVTDAAGETPTQRGMLAVPESGHEH